MSIVLVVVTWVCLLLAGLEDVMKLLEQAFPHVEIAIAHGKVIMGFYDRGGRSVFGSEFSDFRFGNSVIGN